MPLIEPLDRCQRAVERFGDFVIPVARIDMDAADAAEVERCVRAGCAGIKFIRPAAPYGDWKTCKRPPSFTPATWGNASAS